jgi:FixJ family two-component response regulator
MSTEPSRLTVVIAVVDDDAFVRDALEDLITSFGHSVRTFHSAEEFLQSGTIEQTSCLITDLQMPGMSGLDLQQRLLDNGHGTPVIFLTAFPEERPRAVALNRGALAFLSKPFEEVELISHLDRALKAAREPQNQVVTPPVPHP